MNDSGIVNLGVILFWNKAHLHGPYQLRTLATVEAPGH